MILGYYNNNLILDTLVLRSNGVGMFVVKYDSSGMIIWTPEITYTPNSIIQACSMAKSEDGSLYITGYHKDSEVILSNDTIKDCSGFIVKYNEYGNLKWLRKIKGSLSNQNFITNMSASIIEKDNGIIFYFNTMGNGSIELENQRYSFKDDNVFIASLNENGNVKWAKVLDTKYKFYGS
ncbi:MAG: hypothetical protein IPP65_07665 [Chlorobi bacterium]|nr:hypothetical protein [Chlorobiota bacterium]